MKVEGSTTIERVGDATSKGTEDTKGWQKATDGGDIRGARLEKKRRRGKGY